MIDAASKTEPADWRTALDCMEAAKNQVSADGKLRPVRLNTLSYNAAIRACGRGGQLDTAITLFHELKSRHAADFITYK